MGSNRREELNRDLQVEVSVDHSAVPSEADTNSRERTEFTFLIFSLLTNVRTILCVLLVLSVVTEVCEGQTAIASKRNHGFYISLLGKSGRLVAGRAAYCALFSGTKGGEPVQVDNVFVKFAQQVGRIREIPRSFPLSQNGLGRYCGYADLGKQFFEPSYYYVEIHYTDTSGKRRTCRFFLTLK